MTVGGSKSHRAVLQSVSEEYRLQQQFVEALAPTHDERQKSTLLHLLAGKTPDKTGRVLCDYCDCRLSDPSCEMFEDSVPDMVWREIKEYIESFCPECKERMRDTQPVDVVSDVADGRIEMTPGTLTDVQSERKTQILPCGCIVDEPKKLGAIDRDALDADARSGAWWGYNSTATRGTDPLDEFDSDSLK